MVGCKKLQRPGALLGMETYPPAHAGTHRTADTWTLHVSDVNEHGCSFLMRVSLGKVLTTSAGAACFNLTH